MSLGTKHTEYKFVLIVVNEKNDFILEMIAHFKSFSYFKVVFRVSKSLP